MEPTLGTEDPAPPRAAIAAAAFTLSLRARGIRDTAVVGAMERVPRAAFAPARFRDLAATDVALPLPCGQTMTGPTTIAMMLVALGPSRDQRTLEIGTGSGYVTALLVKLGARVRTVERYGLLAEEAQARFRATGIEGVGVETGDALGDELGLVTSGARFDRIVVNGALPSLPPGLTSLLAPGGKLVGAIAAHGFPRLVTVERSSDGRLHQEIGGPLRISPLVIGADGRGAMPIRRRAAG
jgi:protein-L-isoaspartate(D-aspartate) O-methyltransferase